MQENAEWPEVQVITKSLIENSTTANVPDIALIVEDEHRECLFCLESNTPLQSGDGTRTPENTAVNETLVNNIATTNYEDMLVSNFTELFPCECAIHCHGKCLQLWLTHEQCCPICRRPIEHVTSFNSNSTDEAHNAHETTHGNVARNGSWLSDRSDEGETTRSSSRFNQSCRFVCYSCVCAAITYFVLHMSHT